MTVDTLWHDVRYAARSLRKSPGFAFVAILTLALGIGATSAIFTALNAIVLRPLPYRDSPRLAHLYSVSSGFGGMHINMSLGDTADVRSQARSLEDLAVYNGFSTNWTAAGEPQQLDAARVTANFFDLLGVRPAVGRLLSLAECQPGQDGVVVLSDGLWRRRFGSDLAALGRKMLLDGRPFTIIGVAPPGFRFPAERTDLWVPLAPTPELQASRLHRMYSVLARLRPGTSFKQAQAEAQALAGSLSRAYPNFDKDWSFLLIPLQEEIVGEVRPALYTLFAGVAFLLLIACANVANLFLARSWNRRKEMGIRAALGASRWSILRQVLVESCLLSVGGGVLGVFLAVWGLDVIHSLAPPETPRLDQLRPDWVLIAACGVCSVAAGILFGLVPAFQSAHVDVNRTLKSGDSSGTGLASGLRRRFTSALVAAEVALTVLLLIGSALMLKSFARLTRVHTGVRTDHVLSLSMKLPQPKYSDQQRQAAFLRDILEKLSALPGIEGAAATNQPVLQHYIGMANNLQIRSRREKSEGIPQVEYLEVSPGYFGALQVPLLRGRAFTDSDTLDSPRVVIVNESLARLGWGEGNPIGSQIGSEVDSQGRVRWMEVVGVVADTRDVTPDKPPLPEIYIPLLQAPGSNVNLALRTASDPLGFPLAVQRAIWSVDPDMPVTDVTTLDAVVSESAAEPRFRAVLLGSFAALGLVLAVVGIYGVISYSVAQRTREIGVRAALGAAPRHILRLVLGQGLRPVLVGLAIGVAAAFPLGKLLASLLFEVEPHDPLAFALASILLAAVALAACFVPARAATRVHPMEALRYE